MVPKPSSPLLSTYRLVSSSSDHSIPASISDAKFPHVPRSRRRRRPRSSSTSNGNDISLSSTHHTDEDRNLRPFRTPLDSSPELLQPQPILPLRVRLTRLSDPVPILQDSRVFHASNFKLQVRVKTDHLLHIQPCRQPQYPRLRHLLHRTQSGTDYHKNNLMSTYLHFLSHHWQELKWDRVSSFLSIPVAVEKVIAFGTLRLKVYTELSRKIILFRFILCFDLFLYKFMVQPIRFTLVEI
jgi:hypothetical protein